MEAVPYGLWRARFRHRGERTCMVPPGGSNDVGTLGYVNGGLELAAELFERHRAELIARVVREGGRTVGGGVVTEIIK